MCLWLDRQPGGRLPDAPRGRRTNRSIYGLVSTPEAERTGLLRPHALMCHMKGVLDHPDSVCTAARPCTLRRWDTLQGAAGKSADTKTAKENAATHVATSVQQREAPKKSVRRVAGAARPRRDVHAGPMPYKGWWRKRRANSSSSDQINAGLQLMLPWCSSAGCVHKHSCPSLMPGLRSQPARRRKIRGQRSGLGQSLPSLFSF